ncbi:acyl-CoA thioesterase [Mycobacterium vicinigordonae]|uniref:Thioesterase family protein n=1 Tax=Mycobacterium vicinigordonae TaxID=1719132 RepID=A0A7D6IKL0_9MYCO|nr:acyl-CoA thioesterase domain-containing protein [Mycobacterium vicinigordonae]QLL06380.1 thioesterase family protein [Mycobacterium vicinigordonae]
MNRLNRRPDVHDVFAVAAIGERTWQSCHTDARGGRMFGGQTLAQLLTAGYQSVGDHLVASSLSVTFLRPGDGGAVCEYRVGHAHDGQSSAVRDVTACQDGVPVALAAIGFRRPDACAWSHRHGVGDATPDPRARPGLPHPARAIPAGAFDVCYLDTREDGFFVRRLWFRALGQLPAHPAIHHGIVALISDLYLFEPALVENGYAADDRRIRYATTQHSMWFHDLVTTDQWLLIESRSPVSAGGRGLVTAQVRGPGNTVVATAVQEVAIRLPSESPA